MRIPPLLRLLRPALAPTAAADVLAAASFAGGGAPLPLLAVALGSMAVYMGGMALNDLCDLGRDRTLFPDRPLVAHPGLLWPARLLTVALFAAGLLLYALGGVLLAGLLVASLAAAYDFGLKRRFPVDALALGSARTANLVVGFAFAGARMDAATVTYALSYFLYVGGVTGASRGEDLSEASSRRLALLLSMLPIVLALGGIASLAPALPRALVPLLALLAVTLSLLRALGSATREAVMKHVFRCLLGIYLLHAAALVASSRAAGLVPVLLCTAATFLLLALLTPPKVA